MPDREPDGRLTDEAAMAMHRELTDYPQRTHGTWPDSPGTRHFMHLREIETAGDCLVSAWEIEMILRHRG